MAIGEGQYIDEMQATRLIYAEVHQCGDVSLCYGFFGTYFPANKMLSKAVVWHFGGAAVINSLSAEGLAVGIQLPATLTI